MSQIRVMGGGVKLIETMSQNMQFFFWTASLRKELKMLLSFQDSVNTTSHSPKFLVGLFFWQQQYYWLTQQADNKVNRTTVKIK